MNIRPSLPIIVLTLALLPSAALAQQFNLDLGESGPLTGRLIQLIVLVTALALSRLGFCCLSPSSLSTWWWRRF